ncbi:HlyD family type I secretion periplasmic adaptor subunit [Sphingomonas sanguinis]|jgi:HlyD family secretion protein|uniref:HlyD family type I secretion periplasmic adaptor subunit n=1 Tax=Sphingomonas sp. LC-1 TaxID=3110957 RepID=UPI0021BB2BBB|nr:HlyD family type I secretion periplasmic adaptor subunit [Sphingomonas sp. LC-1]MCT8000336.1 HlyD family type I secretion periplasmic adaptor subunit [Sphingomonas sp. LC-1]
MNGIVTTGGPGTRLTAIDEEAPLYDPLRSAKRQFRIALTAILVLVLGFGLAGALIPIGGAVIAPGQVGVKSRIKRIAHPAGGVISEILVENGQRVRKGQVLMRFDDRVTDADARYSSLSVDQLLAQRARLEAERLGAPSISFPAELVNGGEGAQRAMADERKLFTIRKTEQSGLIAQLESRVRQYEQQIGAYRAQINALEQQTALINPERQGVKDLWEKGLVTISRRNQLERTAADLQGNVGALQANIASTQARITEAREQIIQLGETRRSEAGTRLAEINNTLNQQQVRSVSAVDAQDRSVLRAPYDGVVDKLAFNTIGGVVRGAEVIMEIVPDSDELMVEAGVSPLDIDQVRVGQQARIRFSGLNSTATPEIHGRVVTVAADRSMDQEGKQAFYPVRVAIEEAELRRYPEIQLRPGVPAEVFIETGHRTMISYITKPLRDQFERAFRDN